MPGIFFLKMDFYDMACEYAQRNGIHGESDAECEAGFLAGADAAVKIIKAEIERRLSFVKDALIGQSPEDLERHYRVMGANDALNGMIKFLDNGNGTNI